MTGQIKEAKHPSILAPEILCQQIAITKCPRHESPAADGIANEAFNT